MTVRDSSVPVALARAAAEPLATLPGEAGFAPSAAPALLASLLHAQSEREQRADDLAFAAGFVSLLAAGGDRDALLNALRERLLTRREFAGCSAVLFEPDGTGVVVAPRKDAPFDLAAHPEIREVVLSGRPLVISGACAHALLDEGVEPHPSALVVLPLAAESEILGALYVRCRAESPSPEDLSLLETLSASTAIFLRGARRARRERRQRVAAERELVQLRRYEEIFSHLADGMAVADADGRVLSLNPAGCSMLALSVEAARGLRIHELTAAQSAPALQALWRELQRDSRTVSADVAVETRDGRHLTLWVSAAPLRSGTGRSVLTFRDVTEDRALAAELRKTNEFLARLIDATVDGIVASDLRGRVLLWNKAAERVTGFTAAEVVGRALVADFYPPGQATRIMEQLRLARRDGHGRVGPLRAELVARSGEVVPVDLAAALVAEGGEESATVGVFRDLRAQLRIETELEHMRERLAEAEKEAVISELAGAAAHELNQPLTSVLCYAEMLCRRSAATGRSEEELASILREAGRMAQIVRKIGKITRYETRAYVGGRRIVDLDRASDPPPVVLYDREPS